MTLNLPAAVLWDMDGTLIDSEPYWIASEHRLMAEHGAQWTQQDALGMVGLPLTQGAELMRSRGELTLSVEEIVTRLAGEVNERLVERTPWRPGALECLRFVAALGVPQALVTMSYETLAVTFANSIDFPAFETLVTGDMVAQGKPDPECYLLAAERLGVAIDACVAVEDSKPGVGAAVASGAHTIAVPHMVPIEPSDSLSLLTSLTQLDEALLRRIASGERVHLGTGAPSDAH
ncbi:HAD family phosphatase [Micrococcales bacterium 31B]|nr:HAD family phosphatase [Micrococcales bacterium 31B]